MDEGPRPTRLDLHGRLFGVPIRVHPLFWLVAAALGWGAYADPDHGSVGFLLLWLICVLVSLLIHELAHVAVGRWFGARLGIVLGPLGSETSGTEALKRPVQRMVMRLAGPLAQAMVLVVVWALTSEEVPIPAFVREQRWAMQLLANGLYMLVLINLAWLVLNVLPLWPFDGGYLLRDLCEAMFGRRGVAVALGACLAVPVLLALGIGQRVHDLMPFRFDPRGAVQLQMGGMLLLFCVLMFLSAFGALRDEYWLWQSGKDVPRDADKKGGAETEPGNEQEQHGGQSSDDRYIQRS